MKQAEKRLKGYVTKWNVKTIALDLDTEASYKHSHTNVFSATLRSEQLTEDSQSNGDFIFTPRERDERDDNKSQDGERVFVYKRKKTKGFPRRKKKLLSSQTSEFSEEI